MKFILDTNVFNRVLDGHFTLASMEDASGFVATLVQFRELEKTPNLERRAALLDTFGDVNLSLLSAAFSLDIPGAGLDEGEISNDERIIEMRNELEAEKKRFNNWQDALIAGVALKNGYGLVTSDERLANVAARFGIKVHYIA